METSYAIGGICIERESAVTTAFVNPLVLVRLYPASFHPFI
jgi:hypothetical protein